MSDITVSDFRRIYREMGKYTWPGGYPTMFVTADGGVLCWDCLKTERRSILEAIATDDVHSGWRIVGVDVNWENHGLCCDHCGDHIESAYD